MESETLSKNTEKIEWIVVLRALTCLAVVMIHSIRGWTDNVNATEIDQTRYLIDLIILSFTEFAVPCFIMISGCLLLNPKRNVNLEKLKKYILKMIGILISFGLFYAFIESFINNRDKGILFIIRNSIINLLEGNTWSHMWYIYILIGLYFITPILRACVNHFDMKTAKFVLFNLFAFSCFIPTINHMFHLNITTFYLEGFLYAFFYLFGYYLTNTELISEKITWGGGIIGAIGYITCSFLKIYHASISLFMFLETMCIVKLFSTERIKIRSNKFLKMISNYSLGIYIIHPFWLNIINKGLHIYPNFFPILVGEVIFFIYALILSIISCWILYKMPFIKNIFGGKNEKKCKNNYCNS